MCIRDRAGKISTYDCKVTISNIMAKARLCEISETKILPRCSTATMDSNAHAQFLRRQARALRDLARRSPQLAEALRRLADQLEAMADEVDGKRGAPDS